MSNPRVQTQILLIMLVLMSITIGLVTGSTLKGADLIDDKGLERGVAQNALVYLETGKFLRVNPTATADKKLFELIHGRPVFWYRRAGGDLFMQILVMTEDLHVIAQSQKQLLCTVIGVPIEIKAGSTWSDSRLLIFDIQLTASWALKWKPWKSKSKIDSARAADWIDWVHARDKAGKHKQPKGIRADPASNNWARALDREYKGSNIDPKKYKQFTINTHKYKIQQLKEKVYVDIVSWWTRYEELKSMQDQVAKRYTWNQCEDRAKDNKWRNEGHRRTCLDLADDHSKFQSAIQYHRGMKWAEVNERVKHREIELSQHIRGLAALQKAEAK